MIKETKTDNKPPSSKKGNHLLSGVLRSLRRRELGDGLGTLLDGVLGELTRENKTSSSHDLSGGDGVTLVVASDVAGLSGNAVEDIVDEGVHDGHGTLADASVGVDMTENLEDVGGVAVKAAAVLAGSLLVTLDAGGLLLNLLSLRSSGLRHFD